MPKIKSISYENLSTFAAQMKSRYAQKTDIPTQVSDLSNDAGYQTGEQVAASISTTLSSVYRAGGSAAFSALPELSAANLGLVVNITEAFVSTESFVEGAGNSYPAGTNVVVAQSGGMYQYDVLAGFVDLSGYVRAADIETVTDAEIEALFADESA